MKIYSIDYILSFNNLEELLEAGEVFDVSWSEELLELDEVD